MAHLQQTKIGKSGGPQYYFHDLSRTVRDWLRGKGACPVVLLTPYGIASTKFHAVGADHKIRKDGKVVEGKVGHDRIQSGGDDSIGESIRNWYDLPKGHDFERIDVDLNIHQDGHFIISPTEITLRGRKRSIPIPRPLAPLSFNSAHQSTLWREQLRRLRESNKQEFAWAQEQICRVVNDNTNKAVTNLHEVDLLRSSGALAKLGLQLGPYRTRHYDCTPSCFQFNNFQRYECPVEVKRKSSGFLYQIEKYPTLPRVVVLCIEHDQRNLPEHVDVLELQALCRHMS